MIDIPVQRAGFGFPEDLMPMFESWNVPVRRYSNHDCDVLDRPDDFDGQFLYIGMNASIKKEVADALPKLRKVRYLVLDAYTVPQEVLNGLSKMRQIKRLYLAPARTSDLHFLEALEQLEYLTIEAVPNVTDLSPITRLEHLVSLGLGTSITNLNFIQEGSLGKLRCLVLEGTGESKPARFSTLQPLQNLKNLEYLCPLNCRVEDRSLRFALKLEKLRNIHIYSTRWWNSDDIRALVEQGIKITRTI